MHHDLVNDIANFHIHVNLTPPMQSQTPSQCYQFPTTHTNTNSNKHTPQILENKLCALLSSSHNPKLRVHSQRCNNTAIHNI